ncbi:MAG: NADPH-dependent oxidoreductase [Myxococcota bacterium]
MNEVIELLMQHRSIRAFKPEPVPDAHIETAVAAGQAASTSSAVQAYSLLQITDPTVRKRLVELTGGQTKVASSGAFFIVLGDSRRHRIAADAHDTAYDARLEAFLVATVDASLFAQNLCIAFESMGYGICYIGGLRNQLDEVDAMLGLPEGVYALYGLCVGVPDQAPTARPRLAPRAVWMKDRYADDSTVQADLDAYDKEYREYRKARGASDDGWSTIVATSHAKPKRVYLAEYYRKKGARLD